MGEVQKQVFGELGNRAGAFLLDLLIVQALVAVAVPSLPSETPAWTGMAVLLALAFLYFAGMPLTPLGGTLGKRICGIKLCGRYGQPVSWQSAALRAGAMLSWIAGALLGLQLLSAQAHLPLWLLFVTAWATMGVMPRRESAFDLLAGTVVVRSAAKPEDVARAEPAQKANWLHVGAGIAAASLIAAVAASVSGAARDMDRRGRVAYAIGQTLPVRARIEAFRHAEQRWPTAEALGVEEWNPYPAGGGYRIRGDGTIQITFAVLPELIGRSVVFSPAMSEDGKRFEWRCRADAELARYVASACR